MITTRDQVSLGCLELYTSRDFSTLTEGSLKGLGYKVFGVLIEITKFQKIRTRSLMETVGK